MMDKQKTYVCLGTCQAVITQEQYENGLVKCGTEGCTMKGHEFVPGKKDEETGKNVADADLIGAEGEKA